MSYIEWLALGILLILLELFVPGVYLVWFGFAGLAVAGFAYLKDIGLSDQLLLFSLLSAIFTFIGFYVYKRYLKKDGKTNHPHLNDRSAQLVGKTVTVAKDVKNGQTKVTVGDSVWLAETDLPLHAGEEALVVGVRKGLILILGSKE